MSGTVEVPEGAVFRCMGRRRSCGVWHTSAEAALDCSVTVDDEGCRRVQWSEDEGSTWSPLGKPGRPPAKPGKGRSSLVAGRVSSSTKERLEALASKKDRTESSLVAEFVEAGLDAFEPEPLPAFTLDPE